MQVGFDVGATKIESVVLEENGNEKHRSRISCPKEYTQIVTAIRDIHRKLEQEFKQELPIGVCHPGVHSPQTGLVKNAPNIKASGSKIFIILERDIAKFTLKSSINLSASKSCFLFNSKISFVFKFFL